MIPSNHSWVKPLIGLPWVSGARGPKEYDCWGLLWHVYNHIFGIEVAEYPHIDASNIPLVTREISNALADGDWEEISSPIHGCAVGLSKNKQIHHVGIYLQIDKGGILHSNQGSNTTFQNLLSMKANGFQTILFYKHKRHGL